MPLPEDVVADDPRYASDHPSHHNQIHAAINDLEALAGTLSDVETTTGSQGKVDTHALDTTSVHGVSDTAQVPAKNTANTFTADQYFRTRPWVDVRAYGATGNTVVQASGGAITNGSTTFTGTGFTAADVGKSITISHGPAANLPFETTIAGFTNSTTVTLAAAATETVSGIPYWYGTNDTTAFQDAINAAGAGIVFVPQGKYRISTKLDITSPVLIMGAGWESSIIYVKAGVTGFHLKTDGITLSDFQITYPTAHSTDVAIKIADYPSIPYLGHLTLRKMRVRGFGGAGGVNTTGIGLWVNAALESEIHDCYFDSFNIGVKLDQPEAAYPSNAWRISGGAIRLCGYGIKFSGDTYLYGVTLEGNNVGATDLVDGNSILKSYGSHWENNGGYLTSPTIPATNILLQYNGGAHISVGDQFGASAANHDVVVSGAYKGTPTSGTGEIALYSPNLNSGLKNHNGRIMLIEPNGPAKTTIAWETTPDTGHGPVLALYAHQNGGFRIYRNAANAISNQNVDVVTDNIMGTLLRFPWADPADGETAMMLARKVGSTISLQRVSMGATDSGGAGFKLLRVPN